MKIEKGDGPPARNRWGKVRSSVVRAGGEWKKIEFGPEERGEVERLYRAARAWQGAFDVSRDGNRVWIRHRQEATA